MSSLGKTRTFTFSIPVGGDGYVGRECTDLACKKFFKVKPGTGVANAKKAFCPYCGHADYPGDFMTKQQIEYGLSIIGNQVMAEAAATLKKHEFDIPARGNFGLGMSLKITHKPEPIRYYVEEATETALTCDRCTLQYTIYGVFAFCPDCAAHNSLQILKKNFEVIEKIVRLAGQAESEVVEHVTQDALENAVSAFDAFGREVSRVAAPRSTDPQKAATISFQNINGARNNIQQLFNIDIAARLTADEWKQVVKAFQKRHLIAHKMGIVDDGYLKATGDTSAVLGRKIKIDDGEAQELNRFLMLMGEHLTKGLGV